MNQDTTLVILSGGTSSRFWPLSHKMLMSFLGKTFLERQLEFFSKVGFKEIVLVVTKEIAETLSGGSIHIVVQQGEGQGAALLSAREKIEGKPILVINADDIVSSTLFNNLFTTSTSHNMLVGFKTETYFPGGYFELGGKRIVRVHEKPGVGNEPSNYVRLVCDYFQDSNQLLTYLTKNKRAQPNTHYEETLSHMMRDGIVFDMVEYENSWIPLKYPWHTLSAMDYYLSAVTKTYMAQTAQIHESAVIEGPVVIEEGVRVLEFTKLVGPLYIGKNTIIGNHSIVRYSHIGSNSVIGFGSDITRSYIGNDVWCHTNYVGDSVIDSHVAMGAGAVLANFRLDEDIIHSRVKGVRTSTDRKKLGAIIGRGARIGVESQVMPGIKVGKHSVVGPGVQLKEDLVDKTIVMVKQDLEYRQSSVAVVRDRDQFRKKI